MRESTARAKSRTSQAPEQRPSLTPGAFESGAPRLKTVEEMLRETEEAEARMTPEQREELRRMEEEATTTSPKFQKILSTLGRVGGKYRHAFLAIALQVTVGSHFGEPQRASAAEVQRYEAQNTPPNLSGFERAGFTEASVRQFLAALPQGWGSRDAVARMDFEEMQATTDASYGITKGALLGLNTGGRHGEASRIQIFASALETVGGNESIEATREMFETATHEIHHANDPDSATNLTEAQREWARQWVYERVAQNDRLYFPYVESIRNDNAQTRREIQADEYFAELGRIMYRVAAKIQPSTSRSELELRQELTNQLAVEMFGTTEDVIVNSTSIQINAFQTARNNVDFYLRYVRMTDPSFDLIQKAHQMQQAVANLRAEHRQSVGQHGAESVRDAEERSLLQSVLQVGPGAHAEIPVGTGFEGSSALVFDEARIPLFYRAAFEEWRALVDQVYRMRARQDGSQAYLQGLIATGLKVYEHALPPNARTDSRLWQEFQRTRVAYVRSLVNAPVASR